MKPRTFGFALRAGTSMLAVAALTAALLVPASAQIVPTGNFGPQSSFTFGGSGIPNNWVMTNSNASLLGVLLGLSATQRRTNPALTNNGAGTFYATPGLDLTAGSDLINYAKWNFDFFIGGANVADYTYELYYDFDPAVANSQASLGSVSFGGAPFQDSWNLGFNFLATSVPGVIQAPSYQPFDPTLPGQYTFGLLAFDETGKEVARSAIDVAVTPEPSSMMLLATGLVGMAGVVQRRRKKA